MGEDFRDSLRNDVHDDTNQASLAALDAEEAAAEVARLRDAWEDASHALTDAHRAAIDADFAITRAVGVHRAAFRAYHAALDAAAVTL